MSPFNTPEYEYASAEYKTPDYLVEPVMAALASLASGRNGLKILEIGCGNGFVASRLAEAGHNVTAIDVSHTGIDVARATYQRTGLRYHRASVYDVEAFAEFRDFDVVLSIEVIEHLQFPKAIFERAADVLKPGGCVLITTPYHGYVKNLVISLTDGWDRHLAVSWDTGHLRFFSPRSMQKMAVEAGFDEVRWRGLGRTVGIWKSFLYQATWGRRDQG